ncbi:Probable lipoprotein [Enterobacter hormaechei]|nr:Probable lipoprotein [Enterobacter hormaechei]
MATVTHWRALTLIACGLLTGCALTKTVTDGTVSLTKSIFYKKIKNAASGFYPAYGY